jgi:hypothetical protein
MVRAKFTVTSKTTPEGSDTTAVKFNAVNRADAAPPTEADDPCSGEDSVFGKYTPWGTIEMGIRNPAAADQFEVGKSYYCDFTPAG